MKDSPKYNLMSKSETSILKIFVLEVSWYMSVLYILGREDRGLVDVLQSEDRHLVSLQTEGLAGQGVGRGDRQPPVRADPLQTGGPGLSCLCQSRVEILELVGRQAGEGGESCCSVS